MNLKAVIKDNIRNQYNFGSFIHFAQITQQNLSKIAFANIPFSEYEHEISQKSLVNNHPNLKPAGERPYLLVCHRAGRRQRRFFAQDLQNLRPLLREESQRCEKKWDAAVQYSIVFQHGHNDGVPQSLEEALGYYLRAAKSGYLKSIIPDEQLTQEQKALNLYARGAKQRDTECMFHAGEILQL